MDDATLVRAQQGELTAERLRQVLYYHPESGDFVWLEKPAASVRVGTLAGCTNVHGRRIIRVDGRGYHATRLVWLYMTGAWIGPWPKHQIDHKNMDKLDDRWSNLRATTPSQNCCNRALRPDNVLGTKGVQRKKNRFRVRIGVDGRRFHIGSFQTLEEAAMAYAEAARKLHQEFARTS